MSLVHSNGDKIFYVKLLPVLYETVKFPATFQQNCSKHKNPKMTRNVVFVDNVVDEYVLTVQFNSIMVFCTYSPYFDKLKKSNRNWLSHHLTLFNSHSSMDVYFFFVFTYKYFLTMIRYVSITNL